MSVAAEEVDWGVPLNIPDGLVDRIVLLTISYWDVACNNKEVDLSIADGILEPFFLNSLFDRLDDSIVCVSMKVENEPQSYDPNALILGFKLSEPWSQSFELPSLGIVDVQVGGNVRVSKVGHSDIVFTVRGVLLVELVIAGSNDIYPLFSENVKGVFAFGFRGIIEPIAFYSITSVYQKQIATVIVGSGMEMVGEGDVIPPIGRVLRPTRISGYLIVEFDAYSLLQVSSMPAMGVCRMQEVQLSPGELSERRRQGSGSIGLCCEYTRSQRKKKQDSVEEHVDWLPRKYEHAFAMDRDVNGTVGTGRSINSCSLLSVPE